MERISSRPVGQIEKENFQKWGGFYLEYGDLENGNLESQNGYLKFNLETWFWVTL